MNVGAPSGRIAIPLMEPIGASKAALQSLNDALRMDLRPQASPCRWSSPVRSLGSDARQLELLRRLPTGLGDGAVMAAVGITRTPSAA